MCVCPVGSNYLSVVRKHQALVDFATFSLLQGRIVFVLITRSMRPFFTLCRARAEGRSTGR